MMGQHGGRLTYSVREAAKLLGISRNLAYQLARQDRLPFPVICLGHKRMVVSRRSVDALLAAEKPKESQP